LELLVDTLAPDRRVPPCVLFEDDDLLVVAKPAGMNTHAPGPFTGEGLYDWLRHREPRWASLAIIHRLDKETSGVMVFSKSSRANRSLTEQFTRRTVSKKYLLLSDRAAPPGEFTVQSALVRAGERYISRPPYPDGEIAETRFGAYPAYPLPATPSRLVCLQAEPLTGRTHQIRVHAAASGFPILGDTLYGGTPAMRVCLHAAELALRHPATGEALVFRTPADFDADVRLGLRSALIDPRTTNAWRAIHGAGDGRPAWYVDRLGDYLLSQAERLLDADQHQALTRLSRAFGARGAYHKFITRKVRGATPASASPQPVFGECAPERFQILEHSLRFELSFAEGYSIGLFLDQRDNRRRLLTGHVASGFDLAPSLQVLNTFAYTCGFSVAAAKAGAHTTSLDLS
jgi:23S rRNA (cytosine1962-C5)-methyltransferase